MAEAARATRSIPERVARFREDYRRKYVSPRYSGRAHFVFTSLGSLAVIGFAVSHLEEGGPWNG